jgi:hypothetical protein
LNNQKENIAMKRILLGTLFTAVSLNAMAQAPGGPDCGWGNMLFEGQRGEQSTQKNPFHSNVLFLIVQTKGQGCLACREGLPGRVGYLPGRAV